ncbi:protein PSK SIMULATOR 2-like [Tripterygium wilfordii]|uniref:protein PSK SIMULATOR 2-like n=1 Tax=Tripterygium wilfordii TaxID=458696 RepID=UPI0018F829D5|nr:protein PSK SIMULATOR 2-like [Tripterygium wilfordii]XP_038704177.1 protein PSK SIMULATOR 2-like [Tripterygium wilfordii]XP_038704178.1 protein PSK SIMULATOR 2-like [Tripterygium wilfordii]XP_038704179.1 protein PSK SIMULATOR 2-like [Tripterygium wilfordii]
MGAVCSGGISEPTRRLGKKDLGFSGKLKSTKSFTKTKEISHPNSNVDRVGKTPFTYDSGELQFSRESKPSTLGRTKAAYKSSFLGRAGTVGLEVLDTLGSSMSNLNTNSGFISGMASRGNKISMLSFEVANTIAKGANLFRSLSEENIQFLKKEILPSEGVQLLVSADIKKLLSIAASDKREELEIFSREVIRFGDLCKDPQWHNLGRYFSNLDLDNSVDEQFKIEAEMKMKDLTTLAQLTSELYHELHALDRFEQDFQRKIEEMDASQLPRRGESLMILQSELKRQRKLVRSLKKKCLWYRSLEEIVEKLVDIVTYIHLAIVEAFGADGTTLVNEEPRKTSQRLGVAGLALHYANVINQIDNIASRPASLPSNTRDTMYHALPDSVKKALRSRLQNVNAAEELSVAQVKHEMEKTLQWLVPVATNTTKAHQGFGWVGEWANTGNDNTDNNLIRLQTLYHADKQKVDHYILELVTWLHCLISLVRQRDHGFKALPVRSPTPKGPFFNNKMQRYLSFNHGQTHKILLSQEDVNLLDKTSGRRSVPGISKSQDFTVTTKRGGRVWASSRSTGSSPTRELGARLRWGHPHSNILDVMDGCVRKGSPVLAAGCWLLPFSKNELP